MKKQTNARLSKNVVYENFLIYFSQCNISMKDNVYFTPRNRRSNLLLIYEKVKIRRVRDQVIALLSFTHIKDINARPQFVR